MKNMKEALGWYYWYLFALYAKLVPDFLSKILAELICLLLMSS